MTPVFAARRRAEEFDQVVERASTNGPDAMRETPYAELAPVLAALIAERESAAVLPRADFVGDLRSRLVIAAATALVSDTAVQVAARTAPARSRGRDRKVAAALAGFAILSASTSMAVAAQVALPGDTLYPLKRALENAHVGVQSGGDKGSTLLANASGRLQEVEELSGGGTHQDATTITATLQDFAEEATEATGLLLSDYRQTGSASTLEAVRAFTADSLATLGRLETLVPDGSRGSLLAARQLLSQIDRQARAACPGCAAAIVPTLLRTSLPQIVHVIEPVADSTRTDQPRHHRPSHLGHQGHQGHQGQQGQQPPAAADPGQPAGDDAPSTGPADQSDQQVLAADDGDGSPAAPPSGGDSSSDGPLESLTEPLHTGAVAGSGSGGVAGLLTGAQDGATSVLPGTATP